MSIVYKGQTVANASTSGGSESSGEIYSAEETRIGTWVDGRPLYRRVFAFSGPSSATYLVVHMFDENIAPKKIYGVCEFISSNSVTHPIEGYMYDHTGNSAIQSSMYYMPSAKILYFRTFSGDFKNKPITIVIEYVKDSDIANT